MESKLDRSRERKVDGQFGLLPHKFKLIGAGMVVLVILGEVLRRVFNFPFEAEYTSEIKNTLLNLEILGLLFVAWAKDKIEDERTKQLKIQALAASFIFGGIYVVMTPVLNLFFSEPIPYPTGQGLMSYLLFMHLGMFYLRKYNDWYDEKYGKNEKEG